MTPAAVPGPCTGKVRISSRNSVNRGSLPCKLLCGLPWRAPGRKGVRSLILPRREIERRRWG